jgi:hypothetical protein
VFYCTLETTESLVRPIVGVSGGRGWMVHIIRRMNDHPIVDVTWDTQPELNGILIDVR